MFLAHSIRLRDPWQCNPTADGGLRWTRVFHRPTGLEPDDQLVLVISGLPPSAEVTVNGKPLKGGPQFDLTGILKDDNRIDLLTPPPTVDSQQPTASAPSFPYDARLAIVAAS